MATPRICFLVIFCTILRFSLSTTVAEDPLYHELLSRIDHLEQQGHEQTKLLKKHTEDIESLKNQVEVQDQKIADQEVMIRGYEQRVNKLEDMISHFGQEKEVETTYGQNDDEQTDIRTDVFNGNVSHVPVTLKGNAIRKQRQVPEGPIGFHAVIKQGEVAHIGVNQKIDFSDVMLNLGGGYHNQHGVFTAPRSGIYIFSTSIMSYNTGSVIIGVDLVRNGQVLARAYAGGDGVNHIFDQGSVTVVTQLAAGDDVWIRLNGPADANSYGLYYDSFMGLLIHDI